MPTPESLYNRPNAIAADYSRFGVGERLLLTGHSHQAWPDCGFDAQQQAWLDAAEHVDRKWEYAFERADRVRRGFARLLGEPGAEIALAPNTHELVVRLLSALSFDARPRIVTTDGEFHTIRRQLDRMAEDGAVELVRVPWEPVATLTERVCAVVDERTAAAMVSCVSFRNAQIIRGVGEIAARCRESGAELLVDAYHALGAMPFSVDELGLEDAYIVGGGYKYCQLGEGNCFLRVPPDCSLRPSITGWYAEFEALSQPSDGERVAYGRGAARFAGATYDPTSHYRGAAVFDYFERTGLTPEVLREVSQHQVSLIHDRFDAMGVDPALVARDTGVALEDTGGFVVLTTPHAAEVCTLLGKRGVWTDSRGDALRLGPAPYLCDAQLHRAMDELKSVLDGMHTRAKTTRPR